MSGRCLIRISAKTLAILVENFPLFLVPRANAPNYALTASFYMLCNSLVTVIRRCFLSYWQRDVSQVWSGRQDQWRHGVSPTQADTWRKLRWAGELNAFIIFGDKKGQAEGSRHRCKSNMKLPLSEIWYALNWLRIELLFCLQWDLSLCILTFFISIYCKSIQRTSRTNVL